MSKERLTGKQQAFAEHYVATLNGTKAAELAMYSGSRATLAAIAYENLRKPHIVAEINRQFKKRTRMTDDEIVMRLEAMASANLGDFYQPGSDRQVDMEKFKEMGHLVQSFKQNQYGASITLHNPLKALELLGKTKAMFVERQILELLGGMEIVDDEAPEGEDTPAASSPGEA